MPVPVIPVAPPSPPPPAVDLVDLAAVKAQLDIPESDTSEDAELQRFLTAASEGVTYTCGPSTPQQYTERKSGGPVLALNHRPVQAILSVTSVVLGAPGVYDLSTLDLDATAGTVGLLGAYPGCRGFLGPVIVVYTAGRTQVPASLQVATLLIVQHLHRTQRRKTPGMPGRGQGGDDVSSMPGFSFAIPNRAKEMMQPFLSLPGSA